MTHGPEPADPRGDAAVVRAAQHGEPAAFDVLVRRHSAWLFRVAYRIVGEAAEAEDAVQEAWVAAWRGLGQFRGESAPTTWLYRVVTHAALAQVRRSRASVSRDPATEAGEQAGPQPGGPSAEEQVLQRQESVRVQRAIATLEPSQRAALVLRDLEGMRYPEIAEILGVAVSALQSRVHRARLTLVTRLQQERP